MVKTMIKNIQLALPSDAQGNNYMLSLAQVRQDDSWYTHEMGLMKYDSKQKGYVLCSDPIFVEDLQEFFDILHDALEEDELSIFLNQYTFEFDFDDMVDNDNKPMLRLVDDDWPQDRADD